jgi:hypothetical protein
VHPSVRKTAVAPLLAFDQLETDWLKYPEIVTRQQVHVDRLSILLLRINWFILTVKQH